jgi:hypothetical protein
MILHLYHGRLKPDQGGTDLEGNECDDWGFEGPKIEGIQALDFTYGEFQIVFPDDDPEEGKRLINVANGQTGWGEGHHEFSLIIQFAGEGNDLIRIYNTERMRHEYFGDWWLA